MWQDMTALRDELTATAQRHCVDSLAAQGGSMTAINTGLESFAVDNYPIKAILTPADEFDEGEILGDADGSGSVDIADATLIQCFLAEMTVEGFSAAAADVDGNGTVEISDVTLIRQYLAEMNAPEGIGKRIARG